MRWLTLILALTHPAWADPPADPAPPTPHVSARSRIFLRLDPSATPDPDGRVRTAALGNFRLYARGTSTVEASGWIAHAPGAASYDDAPLSGDLTTLLIHHRFGTLDLVVGRQWTRVGGPRLDAVDGITARTTLLGSGLEVAVRAGLGGLEPRRPFGDTPEFAGQVRAHPVEGSTIELGIRHQVLTDTAPRTRWTVGAEWWGTPDWTLTGFATADPAAKAVVEARVQANGRPHDVIWLRAYGRHSRVDLLLAADEVLAVFVEDVRDELGAVGEWLIQPKLRLRLDAAAIYSADRVGAGRYRTALELVPLAGATVVLEGTLRVDLIGNSANLRLASRWPIWRTAFVTGEALTDARADHETGGFGRLGMGFEPFDGWFTYAAIEAARAARWPDGRLAGLIMVEHAIGAPVRWGSGP